MESHDCLQPDGTCHYRKKFLYHWPDKIFFLSFVLSPLFLHSLSLYFTLFFPYLPYALSLSQTFSLSLSVIPSESVSLFHFLFQVFSHSHTPYFTLPYSLSNSNSLSHSLTLTLSQCPTVFHSFSFIISFSHSLTLTLSLSHSRLLSFFSHSFSISLFLTFFRVHSLSLTIFLFVLFYFKYFLLFCPNLLNYIFS